MKHDTCALKQTKSEVIGKICQLHNLDKYSIVSQNNLDYGNNNCGYSPNKLSLKQCLTKSYNLTFIA